MLDWFSLAAMFGSPLVGHQCGHSGSVFTSTFRSAITFLTRTSLVSIFLMSSHLSHTRSANSYASFSFLASSCIRSSFWFCCVWKACPTLLCSFSKIIEVIVAECSIAILRGLFLLLCRFLSLVL